MSILDILYTLIIGPLKLLFEVIYTISYYITNSAGLSIVVLNIVMNVLLLPLYNRADKIQKEEINKEKKLKHWSDHIKKHFIGDERYMILQTYYRQNNYKQTDVLKSSISLLLQVPFFIAAYDFLSNLGVIKGASFLLITNLAKPDGLLNGINILPISMTLINIISSIIYTKGQPLKSKIQLYLMALLFLVLLYDKPSALAFYWTLNNMFSLLKNIVNKTKSLYNNIKKIIIYIISVLGFVYLIINVKQLSTVKILLILLITQIPLLFLINRKNSILDCIIIDKKVFIIYCCFISLFIGLFIPSKIIESSPSDFIETISLTNPLQYLLSCCILSIGFFVLWINIFYKLLDNKTKNLIGLLLFILCIFAITNYLFFGHHLGIMSNKLIFNDSFSFSFIEIFINLFVLSMIIMIIRIFKLWRKKIINYILIAGVITVLIISSLSIININNAYKNFVNNYEKMNENKAYFSLSKKGKNVVVIILDRAIGAYFPYLLHEKPVLQKQYEGFTFYPNTVSFGNYTIFGIPSVYGGYEYTPEEINKRGNEYNVKKHNEALCVMPVLFSNNGYNVTIFDPALANYCDVPDLSIYDKYNIINAFNTTYGMFKLDNYNISSSLSILNRQLFCYSFMKSSPLFIQKYLYNYGSYLSIDMYNSLYVDNCSKSIGIGEGFINNYAVLKKLINITNITDNSSNNFLLMYNGTTHDHLLLKEPEYEPYDIVDNTQYDEKYRYRKSIENDVIELNTKKQYELYHVNMAAVIQIGNWLDYLKLNEVYDNTRIIIVADHGSKGSMPKDLVINDDNEYYMELSGFNPLLLYKDFNDRDFIIDYQFMTNADTPFLSIDGLLQDNKNPFTNKSIEKNNKDNEFHIFQSNDTSIKNNSGYKLVDGQWYSINKNIFEINNWKKISNPLND